MRVVRTVVGITRSLNKKWSVKKSKLLRDRKTNVRLIIPIHASTDPENLVKIGPVHSEMVSKETVKK